MAMFARAHVSRSLMAIFACAHVSRSLTAMVARAQVDPAPLNQFGLLSCLLRLLVARQDGDHAEHDTSFRTGKVVSLVLNLARASEKLANELLGLPVISAIQMVRTNRENRENQIPTCDAASVRGACWHGRLLRLQVGGAVLRQLCVRLCVRRSCADMCRQPWAHAGGAVQVLQGGLGDNPRVPRLQRPQAPPR